jgi:uncharacterized protein YecT (DUF1311 family)
MRRGWTAIGICLAVTQPSLAQPLNCDAPSATHEQNACAEKELEKADGALNTAYKAALAKIQAQDAPAPYDAKAYEAAFRAAQRAWVAYRDADCKGVVPFEWTGGTGTTSAVLGCLAAKTNARTQELTDGFGPQ